MVHNEASDAFQAGYRKLNADEPDDFAADGWDVAHVVADALRRAGPDARGDELRRAISATQIPSAKGPVRFNDLNDSPMPMTVLRNSGGEWHVFPMQP